MIESGYPGFKMLNWTGIMAPAGTPREIIDRVSREISQAVKDPTFSARLTASGVDLVGSTPDEFSAIIAADVTLWAEAVKLAGITVYEK